MADPADRTVRAAGGVLWRERDGVVEVAVVHRPKYDDWSLPKGKLDAGEADVLGGLREVAEETGCSAVVGRTLGETRYRVLDRGRDVPKVVRWWAMRCTAEDFTPSDEVDALEWLTVPRALRRAPGIPLAQFAGQDPRTRTVLLVRHGRAGDRDAWHGHDDERPLDDRGERQAAALPALLAAFGVERLLAAPLRRCRDTLAPAAERLGLPVERAAAAREDAAPAGRALVDLVCGLPHDEPAVAVCSQGGAVPAAVEALTGRTGLSAPKGSSWVLSLRGDEVVDADLVPPLA